MKTLETWTSSGVNVRLAATKIDKENRAWRANVLLLLFPGTSRTYSHTLTYRFICLRHAIPMFAVGIDAP